MDTQAKLLVLFVDGPDEPTVVEAEKVVDLIGRGCRLQVVDVNENPDFAEVTGTSETPSLLRLSPDPRRRVVGDISNTEEVASYLGTAWHPSEHAQIPEVHET